MSLDAVGAFTLAFSVTLISLALVFYTGLKAKRRIHIPCVVGTVAALVVTIRCALALGDVYDLRSAGWITPVHLMLARVTTACFLLPIATGIRTIFVPSTRAMHRKLAFLVLVLTVLTAVTGTIMILRATPIAAAAH